MQVILQIAGHALVLITQQIYAFYIQFILHAIFQVGGSETDMNDDFKKPDTSLLDFLKSKFIVFRV